ncbi:MAG TPA: GNAT family N-acetyltransferase [Acidobacteriaceae bacterium]|nr:GNAT family N-acetyltransferase [Acidobacteriaceae bacterium]
MSSLPVAPQIEVLDLRHFSARQMRPLLEREADLWCERLRWDYRSSIELLLQYLDSRILSGYVAIDQGRVCGYTFCVYEGRKAVIGDAFAAGGRSQPDGATTRILLQHMLEMLRHTPTLDRVESQLLLFDSGEFADLFRGPEFTLHPRLFLERELLRPIEVGPAPHELPAELELVQWSAPDYQSAGELIYACYAGHSDALINDQYRSLHGSLRFLHNIVRFPGCGTFEPSFSWLLRDRRTRSLVGMALCSRVMQDVAHITQLCVLPAYRGRGLGRALLDHAAQTLLRSGFSAITLTVTEANTEAVNLYRSVGFMPKHRFDAMVMDTRHPAR